MTISSLNTDRRAFLKGGLAVTSLICVSNQVAAAPIDSKTTLSVGRTATAMKPVAGPIKINWIKVIKDGDSPKRVFYEGQNQDGTLKYMHYFDLSAANASQVGLLAASMIADSNAPEAKIYWTGDTGPNVSLSSAEKTALTDGELQKAPLAKVASHENVKSIRNTA